LKDEFVSTSKRLLIGGTEHGRLIAVKMLLIFVMTFASLSAFAEDWTTTDGKNYQNVRVVKVEDDAITILYKDGGALISMTKLPPALQKRFSFDPEKAKIAADARTKADAENAVELQKEIELADKMRKAKIISELKNSGGDTSKTTP